MARMSRINEVPSEIVTAARYFAERDNWPGQIQYHTQDGKWYVRTMATVETEDSLDTVAFDGDQLVLLYQENQRRTAAYVQRLHRRKRWFRLGTAVAVVIPLAVTLLELKGC